MSACVPASARAALAPHCGAATTKRMPCRGKPFASTFRWSWLELTGEVTPLALKRCFIHMPSSEKRLVWLAEENRATRGERALDDVSPACWFWPLPGLRPLLGEHDVESASWDTLTLWQDGRCAVCGVRGLPLVRDHDHATGMVRGLLCYRDNSREPRWTRAGCLFDRYRARPPTSILNLEIRYTDPLTGEYDHGNGLPASLTERRTDTAAFHHELHRTGGPAALLAGDDLTKPEAIRCS